MNTSLTPQLVKYVSKRSIAVCKHASPLRNSHGITVLPATQQIKAGTQFSDPRGMQG